MHSCREVRTNLLIKIAFLLAPAFSLLAFPVPQGS